MSLDVLLPIAGGAAAVLLTGLAWSYALVPAQEEPSWLGRIAIAFAIGTAALPLGLYWMAVVFRLPINGSTVAVATAVLCLAAVAVVRQRQRQAARRGQQAAPTVVSLESARDKE